MTQHHIESVPELVDRLAADGIQLWTEDGTLRFRAPRGRLDEAGRAELRQRRAALVEYLDHDVAAHAFEPDPASAYEPFPLTQVQAAYLLGRSDGLDYGGVGCQVYLEAELTGVEPAAVEAAWRQLIDRHAMLRAVVDERGFQQVRRDLPAWELPVVDLRAEPAEAAARDVAEVRAEMCECSYRPGVWPMFEVRLSLAPAVTVLHLSFDLLCADFVSVQLLLDELDALLRRPQTALPPVEVSFRDCVAAERRLRERRGYHRARAYWWERLDTLPAAPKLPTRPDPVRRGHSAFRRWQTELGPSRWARLRTLAADHGLTPSTVVLAAYAAVISRWSSGEDFTLGVTLLNRPEYHEHVDRVVGDFSTVDLLEVAARPQGSFLAAAQAVQAQLWADMDHIACSGVEVLRELGARRGRAEALMPIVFTSAIGLGSGRSSFWQDAKLVHGLTQTPQVWLDCQTLVLGDSLLVNWDVRDGVFPDGLVEDMFGAFEQLLRSLSAPDSDWGGPVGVALPPAQQRRREAANATDDPSIPAHRLLHQAFVEQALRTPGRTALAGSWGTLSYDGLLGRAAELAGRLGPLEEAAAPVAVICERGPDQIAAVLGVLLAGGAYLPIDAAQPPARRDRMLADAGVTTVLTQDHLLAGEDPPAATRVLLVDGATDHRPDERWCRRAAAHGDPEGLAYVIYTSGSTGAPKGVEISHRGALNTVEDVNRRFRIGAEDTVLGLADLGFDLSVYDIFGPLSVGGTLVLPDPAQRRTPSHWAELIERHGVTLWNSVPGQLQMLADFLHSGPDVAVSSLRLALLSGDWIPLTLPDRIRGLVPGLQLVSLGGATEGSIWSIQYPIGTVAPDWASIPYGTALTNQRMYVLDRAGRECPDGVIGEIHIGGAGVALGYRNDPERTAERFVAHPHTGERRYRTGDLGRYRPDGTIEFLGRQDGQVKIRGHRIEIAEVEAALSADPSVAAAAVAVHRRAVAGADRQDAQLVAFVEPAASAGPAAADTRALVRSATSTARRAAGPVDRIEYVDYLRGLDEIALLSMLRAFNQAGLFENPTDLHTMAEIVEATRAPAKFHRVVRRWVRALARHGMLLVEQPNRYRAEVPACEADIEARWRDADKQVMRLDPDASRVHDYFKASTENLLDVLRGGGADAVQLLFPEGSTDIGDSLYNTTLFNRWANAILTGCVTDLARAATAPLRVLEVGAGVGGTSKDVIPALAGFEVEYVFTDLSQFFLNRARENFGRYPWVRYATLDIDRDFRAQGFSPNSFDVVILGDVLHATRDVGHTLAALRELLAPGGWLLFAEMTRDHYQIMTSMELLLSDGTEDFEDLRRGRDQTFVGHRDWLRLVGDELVFALPDADDPFTEIGLYVYASRVKTGRVALRPEQVAAAAARRLPPAMVPALVQILDRLPVTANGKVDRSALADLVPRAERQDAPVEPDGPDDLGGRLASIWAQVLGRRGVARDVGFYDLGGDSLLASQLAGVLVEQVPEAASMSFNDVLRILLDGPSVADLAGTLRGQASGQAG